MRRFLCGAAAAALLLAGCARTADEGPASNASVAASAGAAGTVDADPALWLVKDRDTNIYLFGTIHLLKPGLSWFDEAIRHAYNRADEVVFEILEPEAALAQSTVMRLAVDRDGPPLRQKLPADVRARYDAAMTKLGVPAAAFDQFEPWFATVTLSVVALQKAGYDTNSRSEKTILSSDKGGGKKLGQLETFEQQLGFFDTLDEKAQITLLDQTVRDLDKMDSEFPKLVDAWAKGDPDRLGALLNEALRASPKLSKVLLADRNARWAQWIDDRLDRPGTVFIAVGAGHLAGGDSVQAMLGKRGLKAQRVRY